LHISIEDNISAYNDYTKRTRHIIDIYGDCEITQMFLVKRPIDAFIVPVLSIPFISNYYKIMSSEQHLLPSHAFIMIKVKTGNNKNKYILVEKNNYIMITDKCCINNPFNILQIRGIKKHKYTLKNVLTQTNQRIGNKTFFNWNLQNQNCYEFVKELLITMNKSSKITEAFLSYKKALDNCILSDFTLHKIYISMWLYSIIKYLPNVIYDELIVLYSANIFPI
jgi:hypothetical protein